MVRRTGARVWTELAPQFADRLHVVALTPRGVLPSSAPASGYTIAQLARDVVGILDDTHSQKAVLVGHSISRAVITQFAKAYPKRLLAAIYLDAAFDFGRAYRNGKADPMRGPPLNVDTTSSSWTAWKRQFPETYAVLDSDQTMWDIDSAEAARRRRRVARLADDVRTKPHQVWLVQAPALALRSVSSFERRFGWLTPDSARWSLAKWVSDTSQKLQRGVCDDFKRRLPRGSSLDLEASHFVFLDRPREVSAAMNQFLGPILAAEPDSLLRSDR